MYSIPSSSTQISRAHKTMLKAAVLKSMDDSGEIQAPGVPAGLTGDVSSNVTTILNKFAEGFRSQQAELVAALDKHDSRPGSFGRTIYTLGQDYFLNVQTDLANGPKQLKQLKDKQLNQLNRFFDQATNSATDDATRKQLQDQREAAIKSITDTDQLYSERLDKQRKAFNGKQTQYQAMKEDKSLAKYFSVLNVMADKGEEELSPVELAVLQDPEKDIVGFAKKILEERGLDSKFSTGYKLNSKDGTFTFDPSYYNPQENLKSIDLMYDENPDDGTIIPPKNFQFPESMLTAYKNGIASEMLKKMGEPNFKFPQDFFALLVQGLMARSTANDMNNHLAYNDRKAELHNDPNLRALMSKAVEKKINSYDELQKVINDKDGDKELKALWAKREKPEFTPQNHGIPPVPGLLNIVQNRVTRDAKKYVAEREEGMLGEMFDKAFKKKYGQTPSGFTVGASGASATPGATSTATAPPSAVTVGGPKSS